MSERTVPTKYRECLVIKEVKKLSLKERFKLILGFNLLVQCKLVTQHRSGAVRQKITVELTDLEKTPPTLAEELRV